jgi:para-aminobenzoate synthetase/4-amino-4-deoxychorismate lyase
MTDANTVILQHNGAWRRFSNPETVIIARRAADVGAALRAVETAVSRHNLYAAGFLTYEAGAAFGLAAHPPRPHDPPLLWFGLYRQGEAVAPPAPPAASAYQIDAWRPAVSEDAYREAIAQIKDQIAAGYTYQVNYTFPLRAAFHGDPWALFADLAAAQQAAYTAYVDTGRFAVCSASPELFFTLAGERLLSRPMKGTAGRGRTLAEDQANIAWLKNSEKNRAENVMIVDMIRNDMGRIARTGSVTVPRLFAVERYPTVLQMTSTVVARSDASFSQIMAAMFPCASITGAPKVQTMQIIRDLEQGPRGVYTGAIGLLTPEREAQFNVAIRTVVVDRERGRAEYGVGSGIVWDSEAAAEYEECRMKTAVLTQKRPSFQLLESLLWTPQAGYFLQEEHLARMRDSATYFGFSWEETAGRAQLTDLAQSLTAPAKVRLLLAQDGTLGGEAIPLAAGTAPGPLRLGLAPEPVAADTIWLYHKTTRREIYAAARAARPDCDETLLWNEQGEATEACTANLVAEIEGELATPPIAAGLLAGTFREWLLENGRIRERPILLEELKRSPQLWLINSVRQWRRAVLVE